MKYDEDLKQNMMDQGHWKMGHCIPKRSSKKEFWKMGHCMPKVRINSLNEDLKQNVMDQGPFWWSRKNKRNNQTKTKEIEPKYANYDERRNWNMDK